MNINSEYLLDIYLYQKSKLFYSFLFPLNCNKTDASLRKQCDEKCKDLGCSNTLKLYMCHHIGDAWDCLWWEHGGSGDGGGEQAKLDESMLWDFFLDLKASYVEMLCDECGCPYQTLMGSPEEQ